MVWKHRAIHNVYFVSQPNNKPTETMCTMNSAVFIDHVTHQFPIKMHILLETCSTFIHVIAYLEKLRTFS